MAAAAPGAGGAGAAGGAGPGVSLKPIEVPQALQDGDKFIKWDEDELEAEKKASSLRLAAARQEGVRALSKRRDAERDERERIKREIHKQSGCGWRRPTRAAASCWRDSTRERGSHCTATSTRKRKN